MTIAWPTEHTGLVTEPPLDMSIYSSAHPPACIESRQSRVYLVIVAAAFSTPTTYQLTNQKREMRSPSHLRISLCCVCGARSEVRAGWLGSASNDLGKAPTTRGPRTDSALAN